MWLTLIGIGVVLILFGVFVEAAKFLIWLGIVLLVISLIMSVVRRGASKV